MSTDPCTVDISQLPIDEAFNTVKQCAQQVYRELMLASTYEVVNRIVSKLASRIASKNPTYHVVETPRRFEFSSQLSGPRLAPLPTLAITAPHTAEGADFPFRYDTIPTVVVDPRKITETYVDTAKDIIERAKKYVVTVERVWGLVKSYPLILRTDVSMTLRFDDLIYRMSYDKDYPPVEPPEFYVEGFYYSTEPEPPGYNQVTLIECNLIGYKTQSGEYYSGYGGIVIVIENDPLDTRRVRVLGREFYVENYRKLVVIFSNLFSYWGYSTWG